MPRKSSTKKQPTEVAPPTRTSKRKANENTAPETKKRKGETAVSDAEALFMKYKDPQEDSIGPAGVEALCIDLKILPDSLTGLILAWQFGASQMGYFTKDEFINGLAILKVQDLPSLRSTLLKLEKETQSQSPLFNELYKFGFTFCCEGNNKKSVDIETAASMLELVLPNGPHTKNFGEFLRQSQSYKVINKDQWNCFLEFSRNVKKDLSNYDDNEAWPLLIDEFVDFVRS